MPEIFSNRGRRERMSISYGVVHIGLEKPFSVLHISDSHLTEAFKDTLRPMLKTQCPYDISFASQVVNGVNFITFEDVFGYVTED